jgi:hypothetical protein
MRTATAIVLALALGTASTADLSACGDKFLRIGRSMRYGRYAAAYPATILVYSPRNSVPARVADLEATLKRAGHRPTVVAQPAELRAALAAGTYDLVLTGLAQSDEVVRQAAEAPSHPGIVPVIFEGSKADEEAALAISTCRIQLPGQHRNDALAEIDHKMELRMLAAMTR